MVVKFFASKGGGGTASIDYLLDKRTKQGTARILQGDEKLTRELILSLTQKHKTCVGCLSFEEQNIDESTKREIMQSFENMLLTPEMQGRYNILWVEHTDKGRLELNFVIPKIDLESKKAFNPYFHMADLKRKDLWTDFVNLTHNLSNPKDPAKENTIQGSKKEIGLFNDYEALDRFLHEKVSQGLLTSRKSIVELLRANSIEITREGKDYISVKLPESTKAKRFKGGIYDEQFTGIEKLSQISREHQERERAFNQRDNTAELERIERELESLIQSKARFYAERNARLSLQEHQPNSPKEQSVTNELLGRNANDDDFKRDCVVSVDTTLSGIQREHNKERDGQSVSYNTKETGNRNKRQSINTNQIAGTQDDDIRARINRRSREITKRVRICIDTARDNTERKQAVITRARELDSPLQKLRELIQQQFREFANAINHRIKQVIDRKKQQEKTKNRGFSR